MVLDKSEFMFSGFIYQHLAPDKEKREVTVEADTDLALLVCRSLGQVRHMHYAIKFLWQSSEISNITMSILQTKMEALNTSLTSPGSHCKLGWYWKLTSLPALRPWYSYHCSKTAWQVILHSFSHLLVKEKKMRRGIRQYLVGGIYGDFMRETWYSNRTYGEDEVFWSMAVTVKWGAQCTHCRHSF